MVVSIGFGRFIPVTPRRSAVGVVGVTIAPGLRARTTRFLYTEKTSRRGGVFPCPASTVIHPTLEGEWPAETYGSPSPSHARSASAATTRRRRASATTRTASRWRSTAAGAGGTPATGRRASSSCDGAEPSTLPPPPP